MNSLIESDPTGRWDDCFYQRSDMFFPLQSAAKLFSSAKWPSLEQMNNVLSHSNIVLDGHELHAVSQSSKQEKTNFHENYEQRIHLRGEIQTRLENWHDYLNLLVWLTFPSIKGQLNQIQFQQSMLQRARGLKNRTVIQQKLAHFDECGVIVVSSDPRLLKLLRNHQWQELFHEHSEQVGRTIEFFIFGHGLYEKGLQPYIGMTGKGLLLEIDQPFFGLPLEEKIAKLDTSLTALLLSMESLDQGEKLYPVPILGIKNWYAGKQDLAFYQNKSYFREKC